LFQKETKRNQQLKDAQLQKKNEMAKNVHAEERERAREKEHQEAAEFEFLSGGAHEDDVVASKEAARFAKMMGMKSDTLLTDSPKHLRAAPVQEKASNAGLKDANAQSEQEAARLAYSFGIRRKSSLKKFMNFLFSLDSPRQIDPKKVAEDEVKEVQRKQLENKMDTSEPKAFSRAFLQDPEVLNRLKKSRELLQ